MAKKRRRNTAETSAKTKTEEQKMVREKDKSRLIRWGESYTSLLMGIIVVIIGVLFFASFFKTKHTQQVSSTATNIAINTTQSTAPAPTNTMPTLTSTPIPQQKPIYTQQTYITQPGDDLWHIAERFYKSGYNWVDIAKANKLENPGMLFSGNKLIIPVITPGQQTIVEQITPSVQNPVISATSQNTNHQFAIKSNSYTVQKGDDLWNIAVRAYGDGYRWIDIAKANNLVNPSLIHSGNIFKIPR